ncbi:CMP/dCMP kinase [Pancytospora epiphaga]|nr:CMP/dCMP kinase [Pancytospora epiphaga]
MKYTIAVDGPAASGKSTAAELVAKRLGFSRLDSGLLYRAVTYTVGADKKEIDLNNKEVMRKINELSFIYKKGRLIYGGKDITDNLHTPSVDSQVGLVAKELYVRKKVHEIQDNIINESEEGIVVDGRDIGTVVLPNAFMKVFITASDETRAERRVKQSGGNYAEVLKSIQERDFHDINRKHGPLKIADDAIVIKNDRMTLEETVEKMVKCFEERKQNKIY